MDKLNFGFRLFSSPTVSGESDNPHDSLLRGRLKERCARRAQQAQQARTKRVEMERRKSALSSDYDDVDMDSDDEDDDDTALNDEVCYGLCFIHLTASDTNSPAIS